MPYRWTETKDGTQLDLWPHQSMTPQGFSWFIGLTAVMLCMPLLAVLGTPIVWVLLAFFLITLAGAWRAIMANRKARQIQETLFLSSDKVDLSHVSATGRKHHWSANPYWVKLALRNDGPVEKYLTLQCSSREVELGSFLTPEERETLYNELITRLRAPEK